MAAWRVGIDVGGTFTDLVAADEDSGERVHLKVLTTAGNSPVGLLDALTQLRERVGASSDDISLIFHGTTLVTNAIIERRLAPTALVATRGFRDVLEIGRHWRSDLYDLAYRPPEPLVPRPLRLEAAERVGPTGEVECALSQESVDSVIADLRRSHVESVAAVFLHSYINPVHEQVLVDRLRREFPDKHVCGSAELSPEPREFERMSTTVLNAALMPLLDDYVRELEAALGKEGGSPRLYMTHSNGGALSADDARARPVGLAQSGPVAGVQSCAQIGMELGYANVIGFDMGGTSADIALVEAGRPRLSSELHIGGLPVRLPSVQVQSIGAGGGSIAWLDEVGALGVGPHSAGAAPGPACYGSGGTQPTVTDCNVMLGRLPTTSPLAGFLDLDASAAEQAIEEHIGRPLGTSVQEAAQGVLDVVNAAMEGAIRVALRERGDDPREFALVAFGGAGALHAVELASRLAIGTVIVPRHPGTFSAEGLMSSELRHDFAVSHAVRSDDPDGAARLATAFTELESHASAKLGDDPDFAGEIGRERRCDVRYLGQAYEVAVPLNGQPVDAAAVAQLVDDFHDQHERVYAFANRDEPCEIRTERLFLTARVADTLTARQAAVMTRSRSRGNVVFEGQPLNCPVADRSALHPGEVVEAPCVIVQDDATTFIPPNVTVTVAPTGDLVITEIPAK